MRLVSSAFLIVLMSCGGSAPRPKSATQHAPPSWPTLGWEDRHTTMTFTVLPNMGRAWQRFSKSDAPTLTCRTCHGANAEDINYKMPNPKLMPLDVDHMPSKDSSDAREARYAKFMIDEVVPRMTFLIDAPPFDPKTKTGFGCFNCHTKKSK